MEFLEVKKRHFASAARTGQSPLVKVKKLQTINIKANNSSTTKVKN